MKNSGLIRWGLFVVIVCGLMGLISTDILSEEPPTPAAPPAEQPGAPPQPAPAVTPTAQAPTMLAQVISPDTLLFVSLPSLPVAKDKIKETVVYRMYKYFTSDAFIKSVQNFGAGGGMDDDEDDEDAEDDEAELAPPEAKSDILKEKLGIGFDELFNLFSGEFSFALIGISDDVDVPDMILKVDVSDTAKVEQLMSKIIGTELSKLDCYTLGTSDIKVYLIGPEEDEHGYFTIYKNSLIIGTEEGTFESVVKMLAGMSPQLNNLTGNASYYHITEKFKNHASNLMLYFNCESIAKIGPLQREHEFVQFKAVTDALGVNTLKAVAHMISINQGRFNQVTYFYAPGQRKGMLEALAMPNLSDKDGITLTSQSDYPEGIIMMSTFLPIVAAIAIPQLLMARGAMGGGGGFAPPMGPGGGAVMVGAVPANEATAMACLKLLISTQAIWRQTDADGNGVKDYWTYDVSCFHRFYRADGTTKCNFIDVALAKADEARCPDDIFEDMIQAWNDDESFTITAKSGYFIRAMVEDETGTPYNQGEVNGVKAANSTKFAFVAYPAEYGITGTMVYIINEAGTIYCTDPGSDDAKIILKWPAEEPTAVAGPGGTNWEPAE